LFESYDLSLTAFDVKGEAFEYFLGDTFTGGLGEFFTPRNVVEFIVEAINPKISEKIIDMFCGTGGFLIYAFDVVSQKIRLQELSDEQKENFRYELSNQSLFGTDWKERTAQACKMNMMVHGDGSAGVFKHHGLVNVPGTIEDEKFDVCLTNPPFGSLENDPEILKLYELGRGRKSQSRVILALERAVNLVKPGGRIGIVVIDGIINNESKRYVRDFIKTHTHIQGVISLTAETFEGYGARAKTSILLLQKKKDPDSQPQQPTFMSIANNTGYAPNGDQVPGNELLTFF
jgi:type I restriction enzyme M protein